MVEVKYPKPKNLCHENKQAGWPVHPAKGGPFAHLDLMFLSEIPEFQRGALKTRATTISQANAHVTYPACFQLVGAMNPCRCGYLRMWPKPVTGRLSAARIIRHKYLVRSSAFWMYKWMCYRYFRLILACHHRGRARRTLTPGRRRLDEGSMHRTVSWSRQSMNRLYHGLCHRC
ncbi:MAG: hypothetical protein CBD27_07160 [Rhodospirillaceae bacterium TMED167]|nr:hypothetical protein [Rhodospirillaceae bacterium]OUW27102.1 MAG: hypothetical protein CBD27_07160 [Rhodospirillaceae bacterium TMED167]